MANITFTKKVPVQRGGAGRMATEPIVRISENGQLSFNSLAQKALMQADNTPFIYALWGTDSETAGAKRKETTCQIRCLKVEKFPLKLKGVGEFQESELARLNWSSKKDSAGVTLSGDLKAIGYDFKVSGPQKFACTVEGNSITWVVPVGTLPAVEVQHRTPKAKKTANGAASAVPPAAAKQAETELELM